LKKRKIRSALNEWYHANRRDLPWRNDHDAYKIWLSEVILQQTRVDQGLPYYFKFTEKYPTVFDLANADIDDVMRTWQGLGYYSRAGNLHKCAGIIAREHQGKFPQEKSQLIKLPGIGPYTAAAIASFAFGKKEAVVDGNVIRVISRLFGIKDSVGDKSTVKRIQKIADDLIPTRDPGTFNQAIMEFGALHCTPQKPNCSRCDFKDICYAQKFKLQTEIPFKADKIKKRIRFFNYLMINIQGRFPVKKRQEKDIWKGLYEFLLVESNEDINPDRLEIPNQMVEQANLWHISGESKLYKHLLSHQTIMCRFIEVKTRKGFNFSSENFPGYELCTLEEIEQLPKAILTDRYLEEKKMISFKKHS
jgi:A/G-specific adenine glycosylase